MGEEGAVFVERVKGVDCRLLMVVVALSDEAVPYWWRRCRNVERLKFLRVVKKVVIGG